VLPVWAGFSMKVFLKPSMNFAKNHVKAGLQAKSYKNFNGKKWAFCCG
jgi:hypothetical protein